MALRSSENSKNLKTKITRQLTLLLLLLFPVLVIAQNKNSIPDVEAKFPGGTGSLKKFINANFKYPIEARMKGVEGTVQIEFEIGKSGEVQPESVKIITKLYPVCDEEAIRLVRLMPRWEPALKNNQPVKSTLVTSVDFTLTAEEKAAYNEYENGAAQPGSFYKFQKPIKALIGEKPLKQTSSRWKVYADFYMTDTVGSVQIGEEVEVVDWDYHVYKIKTNALQGYISWLALEKNGSLAPISKLVATTSNSNRPTIEKLVDTLKPLANLSLTVDKKSVYVGECFLAKLAFNVQEKNQVPIQFTELDKQMDSFFPPESSVKTCWTTRSYIENIEGIQKMIDSSSYLSYAIWQKPYCPSEIKDVLIPPVSIKILKRNGKQPDTLIFYTKAINVRVKPLPPNVVTSSYDFFNMAGNYSMQDTILSPEIKVGVPVIYKLTITGKGSTTFPIRAPELSKQNLQTRLIDIYYYDTLVNDRYTSKQTFTYSLTFQKPGSYNLSDKVAFDYFDTKKKKTITLKSDRTINALTGTSTTTLKPRSLFNTFSKLILVDVSQSMLLNDYRPSRLQVVLDGMSSFLLNRKSCDVGIVTFSGQARLFNTTTENTCYSEAILQSINYDLSSLPGTAIWNAIWLSKQVVRNTSPAVLVLIGDGENNAGSCTGELALALAKKYNIKIYTIGLGKSGLLQIQGNPQYVYQNYFSDKDLKKIALQTGGKYFWAKDTESITKILRQIFP